MAVVKINIRGPFLEQADLCEPVLRALPEWFGIEATNLHYLDAIDQLPTFLALKADQVVGFLSIYQHYPQSAEIFVTGVYPNVHRKGVGRAMLLAAEAYLRKKGVKYLQVKTLSASHPDEGYARTRAFYTAMGFQPLEEFPTLWDENNPCLLSIKYLGEE
jgi:ribosomal protein S18 acetylase RimI-like enzyme